MKSSPNTSPLLAVRFLLYFLRDDLAEEVLGDLEEKFQETLKTKSLFRAKLNYWYQVLHYLRPFAMRKTKTQSYVYSALFQNYAKVGFRNILKYKVFSFINVFGLAVAMSVCMLIILMLADQNRYDQFHDKKDRVFRILSDYDNSRQSYATSPFPLANALKEKYPIMEETTHLTPGVGGDAVYEQKLVDMRGYFAEPSFFRVFSFELEKGNATTALASPNSMVISSQLAYDLFNDEDPIGKTIEFSDRKLPFPLDFDGVGSSPVSWGSFTVTGVIDPSKYKSHLKFDVLVSASSMPALYVDHKIEDRTNNWENFFQTYTYVLLQEGKSIDQLNASLKDFADRTYADIKSEQTKDFKLSAQLLSDIQLGLMGNDTNNRLPRIGYYFLGFLAAIIMLSASLNYTNLSIARALTRAKEIGVRKVTGANKKSLVFQFLSESIIVSLLALVLAFIFLLFIAPAFKGLWVNQYLNFELPQSISVYFIFIGFAVLIGVIAGAYPALHLSGYQPVKALKSLGNMNPGKMGIRKFLSVSQFVISLLFIVTSILVFNQFKHFMKFDYGFSSKNIINVELQGADYQKVSNEFSSVAGVTEVSASNIIPATGTNNGTDLRKTDSEDEFTHANILLTDQHFVSNLDIEIIAGGALPMDGESSDRFIIVNETAVKKLGYQHPNEIIGETFETKWGKEMLEVVGVVKDFHYLLLINSDGIAPLVLRSKPDQFKFLNVKIGSGEPMTTIANLEAKWKQIDSIHPFQYKFYDDELSSTHQAIFDLVAILGFIAFLAIVIACLGLLGMATYTAERKTKEVGIRKVLGAGGVSIAYMLSKEFINVLIISVIIGAPLSYFINNLWLQTLANRVEFGFGTVFWGTSVLLMLGLITIGSLAIRASKSNPVDALRAE